MAGLEVTDVKVRPYERGNEKLKGFATITLNDSFLVGDLKIISGNNGLFVAMPSKKRRNGTFQDIAHPLDNETRRIIEDKIIDAYNNCLENPEQANVESLEQADVEKPEQTDVEKPEETDVEKPEEVDSTPVFDVSSEIGEMLDDSISL